MMLIVDLLKPTTDYVFKRIFGHKGNEKITAELLSAILQEKVENVKLDGTTILEKDLLDDKVGILDVKARIDDQIDCDIEMQVVDQNDIKARGLFYWGKLYLKNITKGKKYEELKRTIVILILDFELEELKKLPKYATKWELREEEYPEFMLTNLMGFYIIELPKFKKLHTNRILDEWVKFIKSPEVIDMSDEKNSEGIKEAKKVLEEISQDERERYLAELRQKYIMDQNAISSRGFDKGKKAGLEEGKIQIAKNMLKENISIDIIERVTGLTKEQIQQII